MKDAVMKFFHWIRAEREPSARARVHTWKHMEITISRRKEMDVRMWWRIGYAIFIDASRDQWIHKNIVFQLLLIISSLRLRVWMNWCASREKRNNVDAASELSDTAENHKIIIIHVFTTLTSLYMCRLSMDYCACAFLFSQPQSWIARENRNMATNVPQIRAAVPLTLVALRTVAVAAMVNVFALLHSTHKLLNMMFVYA